MTRPADAEREALRRYVRARAPDFSADERVDLDAWLAADASHRTEYARLERAWQLLDGLAEHIAPLRPGPLPVRPPLRPVRRWLLGGLATAGLAFALVLVILPGPAPVRHFETTVAQHRAVTSSDGIEITLNADSAIDLVEGSMPRIDLIRGDIYIEVPAGRPGGLVVRAAGATLRDIGTRFSVALADQGGSVAVEQGQVELHAGTAYLLVDAGHGADFDAAGRIRGQVVAENAVAPWRSGRWRFQATPLSVLAAELARQQRIQVDIADPAVAALTVSGSFGFAESDRMLWAAAQVHGLTLRRLGERHFQLRRG